MLMAGVVSNSLSLWTIEGWLGLFVTSDLLSSFGLLPLAAFFDLLLSTCCCCCWGFS